MGGVNDAGAATDVDAIQFGIDVSDVDALFGAVGWMVLGQQMQRIFRFGKHAFRQFTEALIESFSVTASLGEDETSLVDVLPQSLHLLIREVRMLLTADVKHRRLAEVFGSGDRRIDDLPGQIALPTRLDIARQVSQIAAMMIPIVV